MAALMVKKSTSTSLRGRKELKLAVPSVLSECPVSNAIHMLYSTGTVVESDVKVKSGGLGALPDQYEFSLSALSMARGLFKPGQVYNFTLSAQGKMTTTGGSAISYALGTQIINYLEYSALVALFGEVRLTSTRITTVGLVTAGSVVMGFKDDGLDASTISVSAVSRLRNSAIISCGSGVAPKTHVVKCANRGFTPMPEDYSVQKGGYTVGGTLGAWCFVNNSVLAASTDELAYLIKIVVQLRNRI